MRSMVRSLVLVAVVLGVLGMTGCSDDDGAAPASTEAPSTGPSTTAGGDRDVVEVRSGLARVDDPSTAAVPDVVAGSNGFGFDLYRLLAAEGEADDVVLSPASVALAFAQVQAGAEGVTETQLAEVFGFPEQERLHEAMNALDRMLAAADHDGGPDGGEVELAVANSAWGQQGRTFGAAFLDTLATNYGSGLRAVDFAGDPEGARRAMNAWAAEATRDRITEPVDEIPPEVILFLLNAIYLKASWLEPFDEESTTDAPFTRLDGSEVAVPTMTGVVAAAAAVGDDHVAVELPYAGDQLSMVVMVPDDGRFAEFEASLTLGRFDEIVAGLEDQEIDLALPRWESGNRIDLLERLATLGADDLTDLAGVAPGAFVGDAYQVADITVTEAGTEAAAVTVVAILESAAPGELLTVRVDRPFVYAVRHRPSGTILFLGRVLDPST